MYKLIHDEEQLKLFWEFGVPELEDLQVYFVSLSARNKYLSEEVRREISLGRTEMFSRSIIREYSYDKFLRTLRKFETNDGSYTTKNNSNIPNDAIVVYWSINPSSTIKSLNEFQNKVNEYQMEIMQRISKGQDYKDTAKRMNKLDRLLMNCYQRNQDKKHWLDIDFDIPKERTDLVKIFTEALKEKEIKYIVIDTRGGYHVMVDRHTLNYNFNETIKECNRVANETMDENWGEIIHNTNGMVPLPGCTQGGYPVKIWEMFLGYDHGIYKNKVK